MPCCCGSGLTKQRHAKREYAGCRRLRRRRAALQLRQRTVRHCRLLRVLPAYIRQLCYLE